MLKTKVLIKTTKKSGGDAESPVRPRTAGGDRGLLRRFRLGRFFFGSNQDADAPVARRGTQHIVRTNSVQAPAPDIPRMATEPVAQTLAFARHQNNADARKSHYSTLSRRSSAPDVAELARRLSRHVEEGGDDYARAVAHMYSSPGAHMQAGAADALDDHPFIPLSSSAAPAAVPRNVPWAVPCDAPRSNGQPSPGMPGATLVWTDPQPSPSTAPTAPTRSPSPPDSPALPPETESDVGMSVPADPVGRADGTAARPSLDAHAGPPPPPRHALALSEGFQSLPRSVRTPPEPPQSPQLPMRASPGSWGAASRPLPPLPMSPLPPTPRCEPPARPLREAPQPRRGTDDLCVAPRQRSAREPGDRPKSLHEDSPCKVPPEPQDSGDSALGPSASVASAKAFLMAIASVPSPSRPGLTIDTSGDGGGGGRDGLAPAVPGSAPAAESATAQSFDQQPASACSSPPAGHDESRSPSAEKGSSPVTVAGARSLRARSRLAGVGLRRASTYMWERSSVLVRALSSTDELPGSAGPHTPVPGAPEAGAEARAGPEPDGARGPTAAELDREPVAARALHKSPGAMRLHAVRELVTTEKNFVDNLFVVKKVWMEPVFSSANSPKPIIPYQTARTVFSGVAALHAHASRFYREMDTELGSYERGQADDGMRIGALFRASDRHWSDFVDYVRNYGAAVDCLKQLQDYKPYLRYHEECLAQKRTNRQSLSDLLMLPIQRITRYTLLLKNILKHTPAVHSDHIDLCRAVKNVTHFAAIVNECRRKQEEIHRVTETLRSIANCPQLPHSETRVLTAEFYVRELISRQPTRLALLSDLLVVAQAPAHTLRDDAAGVDAEAEWSYYGSASLDEVEIQNADESTSTLITILSLNRSAAADAVDSARRSLPSATEAPPDAPGAAHHHAWQPSCADCADPAETDSAARKRKPKSRRGILHAGSRDSIPDHIAALSHSTFPSPVPVPAQLERSQPWLRSASPGPAPDAQPDRDPHALLQQRPKTASGHPGAAPPNIHPLPTTPLHSNSSSGTLVSHGAAAYPADLAPSFRSHHLDLATAAPSSTPTIAAGRTDAVPPRPAQLTLVMQHATSTMRKQFVRALKDAAAAFVQEAISLGDSDTASAHPLGDSSSEILSLHPL
ncbi:hypothetical protein LPJ61_002643 [Coemansia biformis]|uniref:DH domain-containing protein n=1 Tax=Coemansia biformis TaxID=1286918 RepID=A0A9W7YC37_9FUNG|nr:hypothetical protein LPJ61_002643 [Coemansia biformis]